MLQYVTNTECKVPVAEQIKAVIRGGCKWVQIKIDGAPDKDVRNVFDDVKELASENGVFILLDGRVELCKELELTGVHLNPKDTLPSKARVELGPLAVVGVSIHDIEDVKAIRSLDVDYVTLTPFRPKSSEDADPLGIEGVKQLCKEIEDLGVEFPRVVTSGVKAEDIAVLLEAGANGFAVSDAIAFADDIEKETEKFVRLMPTGY